MDNQTIKDFWEHNPCGQSLILGEEKHVNDFKNFFLHYDKYRYTNEPHILLNLDKIDFKNKKVLEIGIGQAADSQQIIGRGAKYYGMDITKEACIRALLRFKIFNCPYKMVVCGDATSIPFANNFFDIIYAHGVLHHIPQIERVVCELHRVLTKNGKLICMLYAKRSLNYYLSILFLRRILFFGLFLFDKITAKKIIKNKLFRRHIRNTKKAGLFKYLAKGNFLSKNTDGPDNPYSKVYSRHDVMKIFSNLQFYSFEQYLLHEKHLPILKLLPLSLRTSLAKKIGWHLWCYGIK